MTLTPVVHVMRSELRSFDLEEIGHRWSRAQLRTAVRSGDVTAVLPGFYAARESAESFAVRSHAAAHWSHPAAALMGAAALSNWGLCDPPAQVCVAVPWGTSRKSPLWLRLRRIEQVPRSLDVNGISTVALPTALASAFGELPSDMRTAPMYEAIQRKLVTPNELARASNGLARMRHRREFERLLCALRAGAESHLETVSLRSVFHTQEFSGFIRQHRIRAEGRHYQLDMFDPYTRTVVELDGGTHADPRQREYDIARDAALLAQGIVTVRFSYRDITRRPEWCRSVVRRVLASRGDQNLHVARIGA